MAERRKNWFQRQMHRMGSMRSSSTTYSSGGLFNRTRHNSVYSSPENGLPVSAGINGHINGINGSTPHLQKITLYDRLWGRKSIKSRRGSTQGMFDCIQVMLIIFFVNKIIDFLDAFKIMKLDV